MYPSSSPRSSIFRLPRSPVRRLPPAWRARPWDTVATPVWHPRRGSASAASTTRSPCPSRPRPRSPWRRLQHNVARPAGAPRELREMACGGCQPVVLPLFRAPPPGAPGFCDEGPSPGGAACRLARADRASVGASPGASAGASAKLALFELLDVGRVWHGLRGLVAARVSQRRVFGPIVHIPVRKRTTTRLRAMFFTKVLTYFFFFRAGLPFKLSGWSAVSVGRIDAGSSE